MAWLRTIGIPCSVTGAPAPSRKRRAPRVAAGIGALTIAALSLPPRGALAAPVPDSLAFDRLSTAARELNRFRIVTNQREFVVTSLRMDARGVVVRFPQARPAVIVTSETPAGETQRASWVEIERIEGTRSHALVGALIGGLLGGLAGLGARQLFQHDLHDAADVAIVAIPIGAILGAGAGAVAGSATGWRQLYP